MKFELCWKGRENEAKSKAQTNDFAHLINQLKKRFSIKPSFGDDQDTTMSMGTIPEEPWIRVSVSGDRTVCDDPYPELGQNKTLNHIVISKYIFKKI